MANVIYNQMPYLLAKGDLDMDTVTLKVLLIKGAFSPDKDHDVLTDLTLATYEISGAGYSRQTVSSPVVAIDDGNDWVTIDDDGSNLAFGSIAIGETVIGALMYKHVTDDSDSIPLVFLDLTDTPTNGQAFGMNFGALGFLKMLQG